MKKIFTLIAAALLGGVSVNAQTVENLTFGGNSWNMGAPETDYVLAANSQWGEFKLVTGSVDLSLYKGYKLEFTEYNRGTDEAGFQLKIEGAVNSYVDLPTDAEVLSGEFGASEGEVSTFNLQAKSADASVKIKAFYLIKNDDTEELQAPGGVSWGCGIKNTVPGALVFAGQYGSQEVLLEADNSSCTFDVSDTESAYVYTFEFDSDVTGADLMFELDNTDYPNGYFYVHTAGADVENNNGNAIVEANKVEFTVSAETSFSVDDVTGDKLPQSAEKMYFKAAGATGWPFTVKIKSATRTKTVANAIKGVTNTAVNNANAPMYNLAGQLVSKSYKGIVIQNGKKFINK